MSKFNVMALVALVVALPSTMSGQTRANSLQRKVDQKFYVNTPVAITVDGIATTSPTIAAAPVPSGFTAATSTPVLNSSCSAQRVGLRIEGRTVQVSLPSTLGAATRDFTCEQFAPSTFEGGRVRFACLAGHWRVQEVKCGHNFLQDGHFDNGPGPNYLHEVAVGQPVPRNMWIRFHSGSTLQVPNGGGDGTTHWAHVPMDGGQALVTSCVGSCYGNSVFRDVSVSSLGPNRKAVIRIGAKFRSLVDGTAYGVLSLWQINNSGLAQNTYTNFSVRKQAGKESDILPLSVSAPIHPSATYFRWQVYVNGGQLVIDDAWVSNTN